MRGKKLEGNSSISNYISEQDLKLSYFYIVRECTGMLLWPCNGLQLVTTA